MNAFVISYSLRQGVSTSVPLSCPDLAWTAFLVVSDLENGDKSQCGMTLAALPVKNNRREQKTQTTFGIRLSRISCYWHSQKSDEMYKAIWLQKWKSQIKKNDYRYIQTLFNFSLCLFLKI